MKTEKTSSEFKAPDVLIDGAGAPDVLIDGAGTPDARPEGAAETGVIPEGAQAAGRGPGVLVSPANVLTSMRIALSGILLLLEPLSMAFYCVYALAGLTDMLDGTVARKTGTASRAGEVLDSAAGLFFAAVSLVCLLPVYKDEMPFWLWAVIAFVVYLKVKNAIAGYFMNGKIVTMHTPLNWFVGLALFALPFVCIWVPIAVYGGFCAAAAVAATVDAFIRMLRSSTKPDASA